MNCVFMRWYVSAELTSTDPNCNITNDEISYAKMIKRKQHHIKIKYEKYKKKYQEKVKLKVAYHETEINMKQNL